MVKVGDIVRQREGVGSQEYSITNWKATCRVVRIVDEERIEIKVLEHQDESMQEHIGKEYIVYAETFDVVDKKVVLEVSW